MRRGGARPAAGQRIRHPAVAGAFYPADPDTLRAGVEAMLDAVDVPADDTLAAGYVVPHAGYRFSGSTAAHVYARLRRHAADVTRVVVLGPAHRVALDGCAVPRCERWLTPLGEAVVDAVTRTLADDGHAVADDAPHASEHSIEVQMPFLQVALPGVPVVPVVVGVSTWPDTVVTIAAAVDAGTVVLCSTDLSHYLADDQARRQDERTATAIEELSPDRIGLRDACGVFALRGTVAWARHAGLSARRLALTTSADAGGDPDRVVGYPAFAFG